MSANWYVRRNGKTAGPVLIAKLKQLAAAGKLRPTDLVRGEGATRFVPAVTVNGLFPSEAFRPAAAAPPMPQDRRSASASGAAARRPAPGPLRWIAGGLALAASVALAIGLVVILKSGHRSGPGEPVSPGPIDDRTVAKGTTPGAAGGAEQVRDGTPEFPAGKSGTPGEASGPDTVPDQASELRTGKRTASEESLRPGSFPGRPSNLPSGRGAGRGEPDRSIPAKGASEFERFAEFATKESYQNDIYFDRTAPWRAGKLRALGLTDPTLRRAVEDYTEIAAQSFYAVALRDSTYWSPEELTESLATQIFGSEREAQMDILRNIGKTYVKVKDLEAAKKLAFDTRVRHASLWGRVLASVRPTGGPDRQHFPVRFGVGYGFWVRNVSGRPLTRVTIAVRTNAATALAPDAPLHVVSFERLDPEESVGLPGWLLAKLWDKAARKIEPDRTCSGVRSGRARFTSRTLASI